MEIVKVGAEVATEDGATALLQFAAVISVNLAVINSLPVPGLDGGQMVFVLAELITQKKLERCARAFFFGGDLFGLVPWRGGFCLSVCLFVCLSVCLFVCLSVCLSVCFFVCLPACLPACLVCLSVLMPV